LLYEGARSKALAPNWPTFAPPQWPNFTPPLTSGGLNRPNISLC
jgi:hypothetical protein